MVHGWVTSPMLIFNYFEKVKENISPDEHIRFKATIAELRRGTKEEQDFEKKCFDFEPFPENNINNL